MELTSEQVRAWLEASCAEQDVPVAISDPVTVQRVVTLLLGGEPEATGTRDGAPGAAGSTPTAATPA
ncbi:MAG: hypothetical protein WCJ42_08710 [Actinomycetes bacterium]